MNLNRRKNHRFIRVLYISRCLLWFCSLCYTLKSRIIALVPSNLFRDNLKIQIHECD